MIPGECPEGLLAYKYLAYSGFMKYKIPPPLVGFWVKHCPWRRGDFTFKRQILARGKP